MALESIADADRASSLRSDSSSSTISTTAGLFALTRDALTAVLALDLFDSLDFVDSLDLSSFCVLPNQDFWDVWELDRGCDSSLSLVWFGLNGVPFRGWDNSVSGGLGGLSSFCV